MTVQLTELFFKYGLMWIGLASLMLLSVSMIFSSADRGTLQAAAFIGFIIYGGCMLAKIEHYRQKRKEQTERT